MAVLNKLLQSGIGHSENSLDKKRVVFYNYLIVFCIVTTVFLSVLTSAFGYIPQALLSFFAALLCSGLFVLNKKGFVDLSRYLFLIISISMVSVGTYINLRNGLNVESENMLIALMAITMFILDGKRKHFAYWFVFVVFIYFKVLVHSSAGSSDSLPFILSMINNCILGIVLYAFLVAFRYILAKALDSSEQDERTLFSMIDNVPVFLALVNRDGDYIIANKKYASNFHIDKKSIVGKNRSEILSKKLLRNQKEYFERAQQGESVSFLQETQLPNGTVISANGKYEPLVGQDGQVEAISICVDDVTPLIKAQEALKVANETKDKLFSIIAHDIKSPLNMFETFLDTSEQAKMSSKDFFVYQDMLKERLKSLTGTVDELLEWSRMQLGGINAYPAVVNVCDAVNENVDLFDSLIRKKNIDFKVNTSNDISAWIDENHFKVALRNLIHNAIKFTNGGGTVEVNSAQNDNETIVRVADTGVGMHSATVDRIIKKEIQDSQAGTASEMGTGLGLSLSIGLLEKNNCEISVQSEIDKGTTFEIRIPNHA